MVNVSASYYPRGSISSLSAIEHEKLDIDQKQPKNENSENNGLKLNMENQ